MRLWYLIWMTDFFFSFFFSFVLLGFFCLFVNIFFFSLFPSELLVFGLQGVQELHWSLRGLVSPQVRPHIEIGLYHRNRGQLRPESSPVRGDQISMHFDSVSWNLKLKAVSEISEKGASLYSSCESPSKNTACQIGRIISVDHRKRSLPWMRMPN